MDKVDMTGLRLLRKIGLLVLATLLVALLIGVPAGYLWLRNSQPNLNATLPAGDLLSAPVRIVRDRYAIPHIFARNMADAYVALGYLHAQDRLFQMEMQRRAGQGRLSELFGHATLPTDRMLRTLGLYRHAVEDAANGEAAPRAALKHYADGVNLYLRNSRDPVPLEFRLIGLMRGQLSPIRPEPWQPADSVVWGKLMGLQLSGNLGDEIRRALLLTRLSPEEVADLTLFDHDPSFITLARDSTIKDIDWAGLADSLPSLGPDRASNVWAMDGSRTASGKPILANDPHLALSAPILWYLVRIVTPELQLTGATVPGVPFHILGHNAHAAWGLTTTGGDMMDLFTEQTDPNDPGRYLTAQGSEPFVIREEEIGIGRNKVETLRVRTTRHGPVISDLDRRLAPLRQDGKLISLRTTLIEPGDTSWEAIYHLNRATDWSGFVDAMRRFRVGEQNAVFASDAGDIGLYAPALLPVRRIGDGTVPLNGQRIGRNWIDWLRDDQLPLIRNPASGLIINANNRLVGMDYPDLITRDWEPDYRARRIAEVLGERRGLGVEDSTRLIMDTRSRAAEDFLPLIHAAADEAETALQRAVLAALGRWNGNEEPERPEPLIFQVWLNIMPSVLLADDLGDQGLAALGHDPRLVYRILHDDQHWCDNVDSQPFTETCQQAIIAGLSQTLALLIEAQGPDWHQWRWGKAHKAPLAHQLLGQLPVLGGMFRQDIPLGGSDQTVMRAGGYSRDGVKFPVVHGAGYRAVYDLADLNRSRVMIATGQSGRPFSRFFSNFVQDWQAGRFIEIPAFGARDTPHDAAGITTLSPSHSDQEPQNNTTND